MLQLLLAVSIVQCRVKSLSSCCRVAAMPAVLLRRLLTRLFDDSVRRICSAAWGCDSAELLRASDGRRGAQKEPKTAKLFAAENRVCGFTDFPILW